MDGDAQRTEIWRAHRAVLGCAWRFRLAQSESPPASTELPEDPGVAEMRDFLLTADRDGPAAAAARFPLLAAAAELETDPRRGDLVLMVVGGLPPVEMQQRVGLPLEALTKWEDCFFDARDGGLAFLELHVVRPAQRAGRREFAGKIHLVMAGGAEAVKAVFDLDRPPVDEAERIIKRQLALEIKLDAVLSYPLDREKDRLEFLRLYFRSITEERRIELAKARLAARCAREREKALERQSRAELAKQKAEQAAARRRGAEDRQHQQAARAAARAAERELRDQERRAADIAQAAKAAQSPLARIKWRAGTGATEGTAARRKTVRGQPAAGQRPPARPRARPPARKIPARLGRDHRKAVNRRAARCLEPSGSAAAVEKT